MLNRIGPREVRITNVWTVEATNEFSENHDPTPNWRENGIPNHGVGAGGLIVPAFSLRIEAEAGVNLDGLAYQLVIQPVCLTNPPAGALMKNLDAVLVGPAEVFGNAGNWEFVASEEKFTKSWNIALPTQSLGPAGFQVWPWPGPLHFINQVDETWQFIVSLEDTAGPAKAFACTAASPLFRLL